MCQRNDLSDFLIHFTKGTSEDNACENLRSMLREGSIRGSNGLIRGQYNCVCFSEAPIESLPNGLVNSSNFTKYSRFGVMVSKKWLFEQGGRPAIYQTEEEYNSLGENHKWRHVSYNPNGTPPIDFTWEREWRIQTAFLSINPSNCAIIVPNDEWAWELENRHEFEQDMMIEEYRFLVGDVAPLYRECFNWRVYTLG